MEALSSVFHFLPTLLFTQKSIPPAHPCHKAGFDEFFKQISREIQADTDIPHLMANARKLAAEYDAQLHRSASAMIPYPPTTLKAVVENKTALALDLGGSTLRIAWVYFSPGQKPKHEHPRSFEIDVQIRKLRGAEFMAWIVDRVEQAWLELASESAQLDDTHSCLSAEAVHCTNEEPTLNRRHDKVEQRAEFKRPQPIIPVALTWSFPLIQKSVDRAVVQDMGKGFRASGDLCGSELQDVFAEEFTKRGLPLRVAAIVNDAVANLAADKYFFPSTEFSIIAGTGVNAAIPISSQDMSRCQNSEGHSVPLGESIAEHTHVFVNMELSMFGADTFAATKWDRLLDEQQEKPGFQPLEQLCSGRYLGEIFRLILVEAIGRQVIFASLDLKDLHVPFKLDTRLLACFEADTTPRLINARKAFAAVLPDASGNLITVRDASRILSIIRLVTDRAASYLAASIVSMWLFRFETQQRQTSSSIVATSNTERVAFTGSVLEKYPGFKKRCQDTISRLMAEIGGGNCDLRLEFCPESSLIGAAAIAIQ